VDIEHELSDIFADVTIDVISTVSGFSLTVQSQEKDKRLEAITGFMNLNGKKGGTLFMSAKESDIRVLCSYMTGAPQAEITEDDIEDAVCELVNMIAGGVKLRLSDTDYMFNITQPFAITGENVSIVTKKRAHVISSTLGNEEISVKLRVVY